MDAARNRIVDPIAATVNRAENMLHEFSHGKDSL
jgi:hypothetical protein